MKKENRKQIIESVFKHEGLECVVIFNAWGNRCGYVAVEKTSPLYKIEYFQALKEPELLKKLKQATIGKRRVLSLLRWNGEITTLGLLFNVHGGITYSDGGGLFPVTRGSQPWWFGFDCSHYNDAKDWKACEEYYPDSKEVQEMYSSYHLYTGTIRTEEYVIQECKNLAEQIKCVESIY